MSPASCRCDRLETACTAPITAEDLLCDACRVYVKPPDEWEFIAHWCAAGLPHGTEESPRSNLLDLLEKDGWVIDPDLP